MASHKRVHRRSFLQRAAQLVALTGAPASLQAGLLDSILKKAKRKFGGEALAYQPGTVKFVVEIALRAGFQLSALFPSNGHRTDTHAANLNFYSTNGNVRAFTPTVGRTVNFARFMANQGADLLRTTIAANQDRVGIATSLSVQLSTGQHTGNFMVRSPNANSPCPALLHASNAYPRPRGAVFWNNGATVTNARGSLPIQPLTCTNRTTFDALQTDMPMFFTRDELELIAGEINENGNVLGQFGAIEDLDKEFRGLEVRGTDEMHVVSRKGRGRTRFSLQQKREAADERVADFAWSANTIGGVAFGEALRCAATAFSAGMMSSLIIGADSNDWHADIPAKDATTSKQGQWNLELGGQLATFLSACATLPDPEDPSRKVIDSLLVVLSTEFVRTPLRNGASPGNDNGDGGTQGFCLIGSKVRTGSYGNISGATGAVTFFNPTTGANSTTPITEPMVYRTIGRLMGIEEARLDAYVPGVASIPILLR